MPEITWIKITTAMFDDEKIKIIESMPEKDTILIIWIKLLAQAGKANAGGLICLSETIPLSDEMLSAVFNRPLNIIRLALDILEKMKMITKTDSGIMILNWSKHQNVIGLDEIREKTRKRVQKHRESQKKLLTMSSITTKDKDIDIDIESNVSCNVTETVTRENDYYNSESKKAEKESIYTLLKPLNRISPSPVEIKKLPRALHAGCTSLTVENLLRRKPQITGFNQDWVIDELIAQKRIDDAALPDDPFSEIEKRYGGAA